MEKIKILVVDDESRMRKLVKDFLGREGYQVLEAGDGLEAMEAFYAEKDIALIILDVMMPKMDGWQTCREIRQSSKVPIIMLTARGDERDELQGFNLGVDEYISRFRDEKRFVEFCKQCPNYGNSWGCPPFDFDTGEFLVIIENAH